MDRYYIVRIGCSPENHDAANANLGGTCAGWAQSADKETTEVIAVSSSGEITRLTTAEAEMRAHKFLHPAIR